MLHTVCTIVIFQCVFISVGVKQIIKQLKPEWLPMFFLVGFHPKIAILLVLDCCCCCSNFHQSRNFRGLKGLGLEGLLIQARSLQQNRLAQRGDLVGFLGTNLRHQFWTMFFRNYQILKIFLNWKCSFFGVK